MYEHFYQKKTLIWRKVICSFVAATFSTSLILVPATRANAQYITNLPKPGEMVLLSPAFQPTILKGMTLHPENPLQFDFIVDRGQDKLSGDALKTETQKLLKYFLASMTIPDDDAWVNLSPYEGDRIIPNMLSSTDMGKQMLEQDYLLKQLSASLTNPQEEIGKKFWDTVYKKAFEKFGTTSIPINTFNKVWIIPDRALILEEQGYVFIGDCHLKIMLDQDYTSIKENLKNEKLGMNTISPKKAEDVSGVSSEVVREIIVPELEKEINEGKNFAAVRQIYNSVILATWYKQNLKNSLLGKVYVDKSKIGGVDIQEKDVKQKVYEQYLAAFRKGVYNLIKEDYDLASKETLPRKYFSGGVIATVPNLTTVRIVPGAQVMSSNTIAAPTNGNASYTLPPSQINAITFNGTPLAKAMQGVQAIFDDGRFVQVGSRLAEQQKEAQVVETVAKRGSNSEYPAASGASSAVMPASSDEILNKILPSNLAALADPNLGLPRDTLKYWEYNYLGFLRKDSRPLFSGAFKKWSAGNPQHFVPQFYTADVPQFGFKSNIKWDSEFADGIEINGQKLKVPSTTFMKPEYKVAAKDVPVVFADLNAGFGENLGRVQDLLRLIDQGLIPDRTRAAGTDLPEIAAKSMDLYLPVRLSDGQEIMLSVFELRLIRAMMLAKSATYKTISLQQLVNEQSNNTVKDFLNQRFSDFLLTILELSPAEIKQLRAKSVTTYRQLLTEMGVKLQDADLYVSLPAIFPDGQIAKSKRANAGHGLVAYRKLMQLLDEGKQLLADQRAGKEVNPNNSVYVFTNGDGPNNGVPPELIGYVATEGIGMALLGVPREMIDIKVGAAYKISAKNSKGKTVDYLGAAEIAEVKGKPDAQKSFLAAGRTQNPGKQWVNTNTAVINGKMAMFLAELSDVVGEDVLTRAMMPTLMLQEKDGVYRLEGAMITTIFNTFNFISTVEDPRVKELLKKYGFDKDHPVLALPDLGKELRDKYFTPVKFIGDWLGMEVFSSSDQKFGAIDANGYLNFTRSPGLVNFDSDGTFAKQTGVKSYSDLREARDLLGNRGDWSRMNIFTVYGRVKMVNPRLIGNVHIENLGSEAFNLEQWAQVKQAMKSFSDESEEQKNLIQIDADGVLTLHDVMIIIDKLGKVMVFKYNPGWVELSNDARLLLLALQRTFSPGQGVQINLEDDRVPDQLLRQSGITYTQDDKKKKVVELLAELGITPHKITLATDNGPQVVSAYAKMVNDDGNVRPADIGELRHAIESASSSLTSDESDNTASSSAVTGKTVMYLEDDSVNQMLTDLVLRQSGAKDTKMVDSVEQAIAAYQGFDLLLVDFKLGEGKKTGIDFIEAVADAPGPKPQVIMLTTTLDAREKIAELKTRDPSRYAFVLGAFSGGVEGKINNLDAFKELEAQFFSSPSSSAVGQAKVLVVAPSMIGQLLQQRFSKAGYAVEIAGTIKDATDRLAQGLSPDVIVTSNANESLPFLTALVDQRSPAKLYLSAAEGLGKPEVQGLASRGVTLQELKTPTDMDTLVRKVSNEVPATGQKMVENQKTKLRLGNIVAGSSERQLFIVKTDNADFEINLEPTYVDKGVTKFNIGILGAQTGEAGNFTYEILPTGEMRRTDSTAQNRDEFNGRFKLELIYDQKTNQNELWFTSLFKDGAVIDYSVAQQATQQVGNGQAQVSSTPVGGIDFDPSLLNLQIKRNSKGVPLPIENQNLDKINIDGLYPVIINMQPATIENFPFLSSAPQKEKVPELSMR